MTHPYKIKKGIHTPTKRNVDVSLTFNLLALQATQTLPIAAEQVVDEGGDVGDAHIAVVVAVGGVEVNV